MFIAKFGGVVLNSADTIVISAFLGLTLLAVYQNYYFVMSSVCGIMEILLTSITAGLGNSYITESKEKNYTDLKKITFMFFWLTGMCTSCFLGIFQPFMRLWVGEKFLMGFSVVVCLCVYFYLYETTRLLNVFKNAGGIWHEDRFRPLISAKMKTTLLIMAAGIGSRFGTGIKQLEPVDDAGHIIMDYSIHDAIEAGFNHVVFIIRKDIEKEFKEVIGDRIASICSSHNVTVDYAFQDINDIPGTLPEGRTKPWGTGQAVLAAKNVIDTPFIVINADDYYGKEGFKAVHEYLVNGGKSCMAGFVLKNTLSDNGGVTRGICKMGEDNNLTEVVETKNIVKAADGAEADGVAVDVNSLVSMNISFIIPQ